MSGSSQFASQTVELLSGQIEGTVARSEPYRPSVGTDRLGLQDHLGSSIAQRHENQTGVCATDTVLEHHPNTVGVPMIATKLGDPGLEGGLTAKRQEQGLTVEQYR